jgi:hypothetical protein
MLRSHRVFTGIAIEGTGEEAESINGREKNYHESKRFLPAWLVLRRKSTVF